MNVFSRIRLARTLSGLSQAQIAARLDLHPSVVTRYEGTREPGKWTLERIAHATQLPSKWLTTGTGFLNRIVCRIELPGHDYSVKTLRSIENHIAELLPSFLLENPPSRIVRLKTKASGATPAVFVIYNDLYCLVVFTDKTSQLVLSVLSDHCASNNIVMDSYDISLPDFLNAYVQPDFQYLKEVLVTAHTDDKWISGYVSLIADIMQPKIDGRLYTFLCNIPPQTTEEQEHMWLKFMADYLRSVGCTVDFNNKIDRESDRVFPIPKFAPSDWTFKELGIDPNTTKEADE